VAFVEVPADGQPARLVESDVSLAQRAVLRSEVKLLVANAASTAMAAVIQEGEREKVVVLGFSRERALSEGRPYDSLSTPVLGAGGAVAYVGERGGRRFLVLGGKEAALPEGSVSGAPVISPDGAAVGALVSSKDGQFLHEAFSRAGTAGAGRRYYEEAADLVYAADGRSVFCARRGESWFVVVNGKEGPPFDRVVTPAFSPDGKLLVYRARKDGKRLVVVADADGKTVRQHPAYEQVFPVLFAADGRSVAYGVKDGRQLAWKVEPL
jgi:hypothetical protein